MNLRDIGEYIVHSLVLGALWCLEAALVLLVYIVAGVLALLVTPIVYIKRLQERFHD